MITESAQDPVLWGDPNLTVEEARELAKRALKFKQERGRLPSITSPDAWEKRLAEGVIALKRHAESARA